MKRNDGRGLGFVGLLFCSGASSLACQILWAKLFGAGIGHEYPATLAVVTAFMAGMALGGFGFEKLPAAWQSAPRAYGWLELVIGFWAAGSVLVGPQVNRWVIQALGSSPPAWQHGLIVFGGVFLCLLPSTAAMGATVPALHRFLLLESRRSYTGLLYGSNTAGAMIGAVLAAFWAMPRFGLRSSILASAGINILCGAAALWMAGGPAADDREARPASRAAAGGLAARLAGSGFLGIGFEVVMIRGLSHILENTVYTFAVLLAVYLFGSALGAAAYHRRAERLSAPASLFVLLAGACLLSGVALRWMPAGYASVRGVFGDSLPGVAASECLIGAAVFLVPSFFMGAVFASLAEASLAAWRSLGWAIGVNSLGSALAPAVFGLLIIPLAGLKSALGVIPLGYAMLAGRWRLPAFLLTGLAALLLTTSQELISHPGQKVVFFRDGLMSSVAVLESTNGARVLKVNNRFQMGGTAARIAEERHADIPLLLHPHPRSALFIGMGTGITFSAAAYYPDLQADGVELLPEVAAAAPYFQAKGEAAALSSPALRLHIADGRRFVLTDSRLYDVIVGDLFHPAQDGAGFLFSREHFAAARERLAEGGLFCQWLPLFQMDLSTLDIIANTFASVFPGAELWMLRFNVDTPAIGLIGWKGSASLSPSLVESRIGKSERLKEHLKAVALGDTLRLLGCRIGSWAPRGVLPLNTDDRPVVLFQSPYLTFRRHDDPGERLLQLLSRYSPGDAVPKLAGADNEFLRRLGDFDRARDLFLAALMKEERGGLSEAVDLYVETARISAEFTSGYAQALGIATTLAQRNPTAAAAILEKLAEARPERPVARQLLDRLRSNGR